jgi:hypothetical protein
MSAAQEIVMSLALASMPTPNVEWRNVATTTDGGSVVFATSTLAGFQTEIKSLSKKKQFDLLVKQWRKETGNCSVLAQRYAHPAYRKILTMGPDAIEWILKELKERPDRWFSALADLTEHYEIGPEHSFDSAVSAWLKWGRDNDYDV